MSPTTADLRTMLDQATPGPWGHYTPRDDRAHYDPIFGATPGDEIALVKTPADWRLMALAPDLAKEVLVWRKGVLNLIRSFESVSNTAFNSNDPDVGTAYYTAAANLRALTEELLGDQA